MKIIELKEGTIEIENCNNCPLTFFTIPWEENLYCSVIDHENEYKKQEEIEVPEFGIRADCPLKNKED